HLPSTLLISSLSLHDALPICQAGHGGIHQNMSELPRSYGVSTYGCPQSGWRPAYAQSHPQTQVWNRQELRDTRSLRQKVQPSEQDRKSTRLNSSHVSISYAVF